MAAEPGGLSMEAISSCQALYWVGWSTSSVLIMPRVDRLGRRVPAYALLALGFLVAYASTFITSAWSYALCLFCMGTCLPISSMICYLLIIESVPGWCQSAVATSLNAGFSLLEVVIAMFCASDVARDMDWRTETRLWYSPLVLFLVLGIVFVRDPPKQAGGGLESAEVARSRDAAGFARLTGPEMRVTMAATCLCWIAASVSYYGLSYSAGSLSPNAYVNMMLLGLIDMVAYFAALGLIAPFGPRKAQIVSFVSAGLALFACGVLPNSSWALMGCALVGRFFVNVAFATLYLLLVTCFPVECRSVASGLANFFARLSSLVAPFCNLLPVGICCSLLGLLVLAAAGATSALPESDEIGCEEDQLREAWLSTEPMASSPKMVKSCEVDPAPFLARL